MIQILQSFSDDKDVPPKAPTVFWMATAVKGIAFSDLRVFFCTYQYMVFTVTSSRSSLGLLNFYVYYVEDDLEINIFRSYQFRNVFRFENTAF